MKDSKQIKNEIKLLLDEMNPLLRLKNKLEIELSDALSREWIEANSVTADQVMSSNEPSKRPWIISDFAAWLKTAPYTPYAEWNGRIYLTSDLIAGRMPDMPGFMEHVPEK